MLSHAPLIQTILLLVKELKDPVEAMDVSNEEARAIG